MKTIFSIHAAVIGCAWVAVSANAAVRYVNVNNATPNPLYTNWATAANIIGRTYFLDRSTNLGTVPAFSPFVETVLGQTGTTFFTDTNAVGAGPFYYRVGVRE